MSMRCRVNNIFMNKASCQPDDVPTRCRVNTTSCQHGIVSKRRCVKHDVLSRLRRPQDGIVSTRRRADTASGHYDIFLRRRRFKTTSGRNDSVTEERRVKTMSRENNIV